MTAIEAPSLPQPLSVAQEALWYQSLLVPREIPYNETVSFRRDGPLDAQALRHALNEIIRRHEAWRTTFDVVDGEPVQVVRPPRRIDVPLLDLSKLSSAQAERQAVSVVAELSRVPYDVRRGPLLRPRLISFPGDQHRLYLAMHHLIFDGVSLNRVLLPELGALYDDFCAGRSPSLPDPPAQYRDYAVWEQQWIGDRRFARRLKHWTARLDDVGVLELPYDHARPETRRFRGGVLPVSMPKEIADRLREIGPGLNASLFQVLATVWAMLLSRYSGQQDVVFATVSDLRQRPEFESVVGYCVTPVVLRVDLSGDPSLAELVVRVRNELLDGLDNLVPFERVVRELTPEGTTTANPIYQTMLVLEPTPASDSLSWSMHMLESEIGDAVGNARLDLELQLDEHPDGTISGRLIFNRDLFETATVARMAEHWVRLAGAVGADPDASPASLPILTRSDEQRQLIEWNATATERSTAAIHELVRERAAADPEAAALSVAGETVSYGALDRRADAVAARLAEAGLGHGDVVAVCGELSAAVFAGVLGVLKAGAAYLLLDPQLPPEQLHFMATDAAAVAVLAAGEAWPTTGSALPVLVLDEVGDDDGSESSAGLGDVAASAVSCVQYTAVAASEPAGIPIRHESVVNVVTALAAALGLDPADTVLVLPSTVFRVPSIELWLGLVAGARVVVASPEAAGDGRLLKRLISTEGVTFMHASPSAWAELHATGLKSSRTLRALSGGEPLPRELADQILKRCRLLWNAHGAAESGVYSTLSRAVPSAPVTIGRPLANSLAYVVDDHDQPVPVGVAGELLLAGDGVASGYVNRPELTAAKFVRNPFGPGTAFRTGTRARWLSDGRLQLAPG